MVRRSRILTSGVWAVLLILFLSLPACSCLAPDSWELQAPFVVISKIVSIQVDKHSFIVGRLTLPTFFLRARTPPGFSRWYFNFTATTWRNQDQDTPRL